MATSAPPLQGINTGTTTTPTLTNTLLGLTNPSLGAPLPSSLPSLLPTFPTSLKVLPTEASVRLFSGEEEEYSAFQFISLCEDVIINSDIQRPADKIAFIRSHMQPGSKAHKLLQSTGLSIRKIGHDYKKFRENFLKVFSKGTATTVVRQVNHVVESVKEHLSAQSLWEGSIAANNLTEGCMKILQDAQWHTGNEISLCNVSKFLELLFYLLHVQGKIRRVALSLPYRPNDELIDFISILEAKLMEKGELATGAIPVAGVSTFSPPTNSKQSTASYATAASKPAVVCSYCNKVGHPEKKCLKKKAETRKNAETGDDSYPHGTRAKQGSSSNQPKTTYHSRDQGNTQTFPSTSSSGQWHQPPRRTAYFCEIHGNGNHSTERCFQIKRIREENEQRRMPGGARQSGEAARAPVHQPG